MAAIDTGPELLSSPSSSPSSHEQQPGNTVWTSPPKRPAGRTKFKETRHPVYRGVRRRGGGSRWVCEVRVPGKHGERLWLGTHVTAEAAARAHDAAMLALGSAACLNFADSAWLLAVLPSSALSSLADVRRGALQAVADLLRREAADVAVIPCDEEVISNLISAPSSSYYVTAAVIPCDEEISSLISTPSPSYYVAAAVFPCDEVISSLISAPSPSYYAGDDITLEVPTALDNDMFELDMSGESDLGAYYAMLAAGLDMEPPSPRATEAYRYLDNGGGDDSELWSYQRASIHACTGKSPREV